MDKNVIDLVYNNKFVEFSKNLKSFIDAKINDNEVIKEKILEIEKYRSFQNSKNTSK